MLAILLIFLFSIYFLYWNAKRKSYPPGPTPVPLLGNLLQINYHDSHVDLLKWKKQYGNIFTIWMPYPCVVVSDYEPIKEYFVNQGEIFAGRPDLNINKDLVGGAHGLLFNNNAWYKSQRHYAYHVLKKFEEPSIQTVMGHVIFKLLFGHVHEHNEDLHMLARKFNDINGIYNSFIGSLIEISLKFKVLDPLFGGHYTSARKKNDEILDYLRKEIESHKRTINYEEQPRDFIDAYLQEMRKREKAGDREEFTDHQLLISIYDLVGTGLRTPSATLRKFFLYMLHYPEVQKKIHSEIDNIIGIDVPITMADLTRLPYLNATMQELYRLAILSSLNIIRVVLEDTQIGKYTIPKGTVVLPQTQSVHLDEDIFSEPERLIPERHLDQHGNYRKDERITPYSLGKRSCLGESFARMEIFYCFTLLLQKFEFQPEIPGQLPPFEYIDGLLRDLKPFKCRAIPRK